MQAEWLRAINQATDKILTDQKNLVRPRSSAGGRLTPPLARQATHVFYKNALLKDAKYTGMWLAGKMHGQFVSVHNYGYQNYTYGELFVTWLLWFVLFHHCYLLFISEES